jgi:glycosyltransferase involved in cell wall biosynthesis
MTMLVIVLSDTCRIATPLHTRDESSSMQHTPGKPSISVAMATYNGEQFILRQLESLSAQTYLPLELVVSDDGSSDATLDLIRSFARTAPFEIRLLPTHARLGFSDNFLHAAEHCRGSYVAFCDQDDEWLPHKLETQLVRMQGDDSILALHRLMIADATLKPTGDIWSQDIIGDSVFNPLELNPYRTGWGNSMLFERRLLQVTPRGKRPRQPESCLPLSHDTWIYVLAAGLGRVSHLLEPLLLYRQHESSVYGVGPMPLPIKIRAAVLPPESRLIEEAIFDRHMASILDDVSKSQNGLAVYARIASKAYRNRAKLCELRLETYKGRSLRGRLQAYQESRRLLFYRPTRKSSIKEAAFGVLGISQLLRPLINRAYPESATHL